MRYTEVWKNKMKDAMENYDGTFAEFLIENDFNFDHETTAKMAEWFEQVKVELNFADRVRKASNEKQEFRAGKQWAVDFIDENGYSGIEDLYAASWDADDTIESNAFNDGVCLVGMETEIESIKSYMEYEEVASYRATDWANHNDGDVTSQIEYREDNISDAELEIQDLNTDIDKLYTKYN